MMNAPRHPGIKASSRAFTLTEMMIAIALLLVVIIATSQIFGTASKVTGLGQATQAVLTEAAAIEQQIRADIANLSREGVIAIRCTAVRNDVNTATGGALLNPNLPSNAYIRSDQLLFFINRLEAMQALRLSGGGSSRAQGTASRMYYGHAFQLPLGPPYEPISEAHGRACDASSAANFINMTPWRSGLIPTVKTLFSTIGAQGVNTNINIFENGTAGPTINAAQPEARRWLLARQGAVLADDSETLNNSNAKTVALTNTLMGRSIFYHPVYAAGLYGHSRELRNGRVDGAASLLNEIRRTITMTTPSTTAALPNMRDWFNPAEAPPGDQRAIIRNSALYYPRAERRAPSMHRVDQALTNHVISGGCSSFTIDWTYSAGTGEVLDAQGNVVDPDGNPGNGDELYGMGIPQGSEQPWFGMPSLENFPANTDLPDPQRGTLPYFNWLNPANTFYADHIDGLPTQMVVAGNPIPAYVYEAFFGYNQSEPLDAVGALWPFNSERSYTPWPTGLRITMTLHDPELRLEGGKEVQFVIDLPRQQ